jgi:hypothetical protein
VKDTGERVIGCTKRQTSPLSEVRWGVAKVLQREAGRANCSRSSVWSTMQWKPQNDKETRRIAERLVRIPFGLTHTPTLHGYLRADHRVEPLVVSQSTRRGSRAGYGSILQMWLRGWS